MVIHSFAIYLPTSTVVFISSRRLRHSLEIQRSQNLPGSEIRGRRSKTKIRPPDFSSARWGHVPFCRLFLPLVLMGSDSSFRSSFRSLMLWCLWLLQICVPRLPCTLGRSCRKTQVYKSARYEFHFFFPLQISDHISKLWFLYLYNQHKYAYVEEL